MTNERSRIVPPKLNQDQVRELTALAGDLKELKALAQRFGDAGFDTSSVDEQIEVAERQRKFLLDEFGGRPTRRR